MKEPKPLNRQGPWTLDAIPPWAGVILAVLLFLAGVDTVTVP